MYSNQQLAILNSVIKYISRRNRTLSQNKYESGDKSYDNERYIIKFIVVGNGDFWDIV